jgi:hypothetical protein
MVLQTRNPSLAPFLRGGTRSPESTGGTEASGNEPCHDRSSAQTSTSTLQERALLYQTGNASQESDSDQDAQMRTCSVGGHQTERYENGPVVHRYARSVTGGMRGTFRLSLTLDFWSSSIKHRRFEFGYTFQKEYIILANQTYVHIAHIF